ncbi:MAG TPA: hypothetical protein VGF24_24875 [Vicinamibacterales bacterium]
MRNRGAPIAVFCAAWAFRFLTTGALENDHFVSLARAHQVLHGAWPVRDFFDPGQPLAYVMSAGAAIVAGPSLLTEVALAVSILALAASVTYVLARRASGSDLIALAAVGLALASYPRLYNAAKLLIPAVAVWLGWRYVDRPSTGRLAVLGAWTALAFLWRHDFAVYIGAPTLVLIFYEHAGSLPLARRRALEYVAWCVACLIPWAAYVQWAAGLGFYLASASRFVAIEAQRTGRPDNVALLLIIIVIPVVAIGLARLQPGRITHDAQTPGLTLSHVVFAGTMAMALDIVFLRDVITARLPDVASLTVVLLASIAGRAPRTLVRAIAVAAVIGTVIAVTVVPMRRQGYRAPTPGRIVRRAQMIASNLHHATPAAVPDLELLPLVDYLAACTPATDRVLVSGFAPQIPVLARRAFAAGLPSWFGGYYTSASEVDRAAAILAREQVSLAVMLDGAGAFTSAWPGLAADLRARGFVERTWKINDRAVVVWLPADRARDTPSCP